MADVPFAFIRDMMAAALGVEAHLLRPPYKDAQEFDYCPAFCARILITRTFSAQAPCAGWRKAPCTMCTIRWS